MRPCLRVSWSPHLLVLAAFIVALAPGCKCGSGGGGTPIARAPVSAPNNENLPRELSPLPPAPPLQIAQEALPQGDLTVVAVRPKGEIRGEVRPTITFSKPVKTLEMVEAQAAEDAKAPVARIEPAIEGEWRWLGSASVELVPKGLVPYATPFKVTVLKGLKALDGSALAEDYAFEFTTPRPELQGSTPREKFRWLRADQHVELLFNQPVREDQLAQLATFSVQGEPNPIPVRVVSSISIAEERRREEEKAKKEGRRYERMDWEDRGFKNRQQRYEIAPVRPLPLGKQVHLRIDPKLSGAEGPLTLAAPVDLTYRTYGPLALASARMCDEGDWRCPYGPLVVFTSNPVDAASFKDKVKITPPAEIDWARVEAWAPHEYYDGERSPYVAFPGKFRPGRTYKVEIAAGAKDDFGQPTAAPSSFDVRTDDLAGHLDPGGMLAVIEASSGPKLPVQVTNLRSLDTEIWKPTLPELARILARPYEQKFFARGPDFSEYRQELTYPHNESVVHGVDLSKVFGGKPTGIAALALNSWDLEHRSDRGYRVIAQVTDLAAHVKVAPKKSLAWVTRLSSGEPVAGADVEVFDRGGQSLWKGKTDASGFADVPGTVDLKVPSPKYAWEYPFVLVVASLGEDMAFTSDMWNSGVNTYDFGVEAGWEGEQPVSTGLVFTDRGIYRPGDKVYVKGVARYREVGAMVAPKAGSTLALTVTDSRDQKVLDSAVKVTRYGTFSAEAQIPKDAPTGYYQVRAVGQAPRGELAFSGTFRVEEYRAPQFKVDVRAVQPSLVAGDPLEARVSARYLFGGAMNDAQVKWSAHSQSTSFDPAGSDGFTFAQETWWWDDNEAQPTGGFFASGEGKVDAKGALAISAGQVEAPGEKTFQYTVEAEVTDVNRQAVAGRASVTVHPADYYVGLRGPTGFPEAGKEMSIEAIATDTSGKRVEGRKLEIAIQRREWKSIRQKDAGGGYSTVSEPVETEVHRCKLESKANAVACKYTPDQPGFYIVRGSTSDDEGRKHTASLGLYAIGQGWISWQRDDTQRVDLLADKTVYDVGDVAKVLVKSPYKEARALLTVEREGVLERRPVKLVGSVQTLEIPITEEMVPNVFASVLLVRPRVAEGGIESGDDPGRPAVRVGLVKLSVERKTRRLSVALATDKQEYRPGDEVNVDVAVANHAGKGEQAEVTLYVVDEAVLRLTSYEVPDPIAAIYPDRPLSVRLGEPLLNLVRRRSLGEKGEDSGGGGGNGEGAGIRSNFQTTALFLPALETDAAGKAKAKFKLPDNLSTFRVMGVAVTPGDRFGAGQSELKVNKPLLALPAMPRFARVGDQFEAGVVVHSYGAGDGMVTVTVAAEGAKLVGSPEMRVQVPDGSPREVRFKFLAERAGKASFTFRVARGAEKDGVLEKIPVEMAVSPEAVATYGDTDGERVEGLAPPAGMLPDVGGLDLTLASTSLGNFQQGMRQLVDYPYGCLEQQASRLIPFVALRELSSQFGVAWQAPDKKKTEQLAAMNAFFRDFLFDPLDVTGLKDPDEVVTATVRSIQALQDSDGSFRYWADSSCNSSWQSAWATLALSRAKQVGYDVDPERLQRATEYVKKVAGGGCHPCELACPTETRTMAAYVLARTGQPKPSYYGELLSKRNELSLFGQALLADAIFVGGGDRGQAKALLQEILNHAKESAQGLHFEEVQGETYATLWASDTRTTGAVLETLTDITPEHPFVSKMAHYLTGVRRGDGTWRSTQEAAFSLMALAEVVRTKEKDVPDFTAKVALGGQTLAEEQFKGRSMEVREKHVPMADLAKLSGGKLTFRKEGSGVLYYSALMRYAPKELPTKALDRGLFVQRWFEPYTGGGQTTRFYAGDLVRVRVRVASNQERHWAAFEVPLPAGLEAVDTSLGTTAAQSMSAEEEGPEEEYEYESDEDQTGGSEQNPWAYRFWSPFNHVERRDSRVVLFADHLPPGIHVASFVARATTPGTFILKPARGELMYEPEVFGRSEGGTFEVVLPPVVTER